jgi:hypothetical protein
MHSNDPVQGVESGEPRRWKIIAHVREKSSCRHWEAVTEAPAPRTRFRAAFFWMRWRWQARFVAEGVKG